MNPGDSLLKVVPDARLKFDVNGSEAADNVIDMELRRPAAPADPPARAAAAAAADDVDDSDRGL